MTDFTVTISDEDIDEALQQARSEPEDPHIVEAVYQPDLELFILKLSDGRRLVLPRENLQAVANATQEQAADFRLVPTNSGIWWPQLDEGHGLDNLLEGRTGNEKWMAKIERREVAA